MSIPEAEEIVEEALNELTFSSDPGMARALRFLAPPGYQAIVELSKSQIILDTIKNIFIHVRAIRRMTISQSDRASRSIVDHLRIIEALEQRDTELAERLTRQHSLDLAAFVEANCDFLD